MGKEISWLTDCAKKTYHVNFVPEEELASDPRIQDYYTEMFERDWFFMLGKLRGMKSTFDFKKIIMEVLKKVDTGNGLWTMSEWLFGSSHSGASPFSDQSAKQKGH